ISMQCPTIYFILGWLAITQASSFSQEAQTEDAKLAAYFQDCLDREFKLKPFEATRLGDHRFDHLLEDLSSSGRAGWREQMRTFLVGLPTAADFDRLSASGKIDHGIFTAHLRRTLWLMENTHPFELDPRIYNDYISDSVYLLLTQSSLPKAENLK